MRNLLVLIAILLPLLGGGSLLILRPQSETARRIYSELVVILAAVICWAAIFADDADAFVFYSFTRGFTMEFRADSLGMIFAGMISLMWPLVMLYAFEYMEGEHRRTEFYAFYVMTFGITLGIAFAGNLITLYVFYEMLTLVTLPLVSHYADHESMFAGRVYAAYTIGGAGLAFVPVVTATLRGSTDFVYGGTQLASISPMLLQVVFLFGFLGFGTKAAIFPLCRWLPIAGVAPTPVTALLHAVAVVNSGVFAVIRLAWYVYGPDQLAGTWVQNFCVILAAFTLVYAAVQAVRARHFKRRLAWSTVSNLSYMLFGVLLMTPMGLEAGVMHMVFHGIIKMTLFLCAGAFMVQTGNSYVYQINGVGKKMPWTFALYTLGALSLTGIPMFCGFVSKWNLLLAGAQAQTTASIIGVAALIVSAFFCAIYTLSVSVRAFFPVGGKDLYSGEGRVMSPRGGEVHDPGWMMLFPIAVFSVVNVVLGVYPGPFIDFLSKVAAGLV